MNHGGPRLIKINSDTTGVGLEQITEEMHLELAIVIHPPHSRLRAILDPLEKHWHFVEVRSKGSKSEVSLTEQGTSALKIFGAGTST